MTTLTATLTEQFLREGTYLRNWSPRTVTTHRDSLATLPTDSLLTKDTLNAWVAGLRKRGITAGGVNLRARSLNSFFSWLHQEGHTAERLRVKMLPNPLRPINLLRDEDVRRLVAFRPWGVNQRRAWTLAITLLDTGLRIDEALGLESANVNLDDLVLRVMGKGRKERLVPVSVEVRKHLYRWLAASTGRYVFGVREGGRMSRTNARRDIRVICKTLGITAAVNPREPRSLRVLGPGGALQPGSRTSCLRPSAGDTVSKANVTASVSEVLFSFLREPLSIRRPFQRSAQNENSFSPRHGRISTLSLLFAGRGPGQRTRQPKCAYSSEWRWHTRNCSVVDGLWENAQ